MSEPVIVALITAGSLVVVALISTGFAFWSKIADIHKLVNADHTRLIENQARLDEKVAALEKQLAERKP
jgi:hypothetical protein